MPFVCGCAEQSERAATFDCKETKCLVSFVLRHARNVHAKVVHLERSNRTHQNFLDLPMRNGEHGILQGWADTIEIVGFPRGLISSQTHSRFGELTLTI